MAEINGGFTIWARQTIDSDIFYSKPDKWFKIWFFLVNYVNHMDNKHFPRGTNFVSYSLIQEKTGATKAQCDMFFRWSKKCKMLTTRKTTRGLIINIDKYSLFQDSDKYRNDTKNETKTTQKRHRNDTINKNEKNEKNISDASIADDVQIILEPSEKKRKKKESTFNPLGQEIIKAFENINPATKKMYNMPPQCSACDDLLREYGLDRTLKAVAFVEKVRGRDYYPTITTPAQLFQKWAALEQAAVRGKSKSDEWRSRVTPDI